MHTYVYRFFTCCNSYDMITAYLFLIPRGNIALPVSRPKNFQLPPLFVASSNFSDDRSLPSGYWSVVLRRFQLMASLAKEPAGFSQIKSILFVIWVMIRANSVKVNKFRSIYILTMMLNKNLRLFSIRLR